MEAEVEMTASLVVDGPDGRLLGSRASANGEERSNAGSACSGGADAISIAASDATEDLMNSLGERLSNAPRLGVVEGTTKAGL